MNDRLGGHFYLARSGHYNLAATVSVQAVLSCRVAGYIQMSARACFLCGLGGFGEFSVGRWGWPETAELRAG